MSKKKKNEPRPCFKCSRCGSRWVYHIPVCTLCMQYGEPLNAPGERLIQKWKMRYPDDNWDLD